MQERIRHPSFFNPKVTNTALPKLRGIGKTPK